MHDKRNKRKLKAKCKLTHPASAKAKPQNTQYKYRTGKTSAPPRLCEKPTQRTFTTKETKEGKRRSVELTPAAFAKAQRSKHAE